MNTTTLQQDLTNLKSDIAKLHKDVEEALDHLKYHLGVKRMDERDIEHMSSHLKLVDEHMGKLTEHLGELEEKHG